MIKVRIYLHNRYWTYFDENIYAETELLVIPRIGETLFLNDKCEDELISKITQSHKIANHYIEYMYGYEGVKSKYSEEIDLSEQDYKNLCSEEGDVSIAIEAFDVVEVLHKVGQDYVTIVIAEYNYFDSIDRKLTKIIKNLGISYNYADPLGFFYK